MEKIVTIESFDVMAVLTNYVAWGLSANGWETNGLTSFSDGSLAFPIDVTVTGGEVFLKVFRDFNANGTYDAGIDALIVKRMTKADNIGSVTVRIGDSDRDGVSDTQELADGTDPCDARNFRMEKIVTIESFDVAMGLTNYVAWGLSASGWETNGLASFSGDSLAFPIDVTVTSGEVYVKVFRDFNANGFYDAGTDALVIKRLTKADNGRLVTVRIGDSDGDGVTDTQEFADGTDPCDAKNFRFSVTVKVTNDDNVSTITNYLACGLTPTGLETNGLVSFARTETGFFSTHFEDIVTNGVFFMKCVRDLNRNGLYDPEEDALAINRIDSVYAGKTYQATIGDADGDKVLDSVELAEWTNPLNNLNYCFNMSAEVTGIFHTTNQLTLIATFGTNIIYGPLVMTTNIWSTDFGHLLVTNGEKVVLTFWDDANSNGVREAEETAVNLTLPITNHTNACSYKLSYGAFDADHNGIPDWWEVATGLNVAANGGPYDDTDGDGLINLHEYYSTTNPLDATDGTNTAIYALIHSIDDRLLVVGSNSMIDVQHIYRDYETTYMNNTIIPNTNAWTYGIDFTMVGIRCTRNGNINHGLYPTVISERHIIFATHCDPHTNDVYHFMSQDGTCYDRTLIALKNSINVVNDVMIGLLDEALPPTITPVYFLPENYWEFIGNGEYLPTIRLNQWSQAVVQEINRIPRVMQPIGDGSAPVVEYRVSDDPIRESFRDQVIFNDSGHPNFLIAGNTPIFLFPTHYGVQEWNFGTSCLSIVIKDEIEQMMNGLCAENGITNHYSIRQFDFSTLINQQEK